MHAYIHTCIQDHHPLCRSIVSIPHYSHSLFSSAVYATRLHMLYTESVSAHHLGIAVKVSIMVLFSAVQ